MTVSLMGLFHTIITLSIVYGLYAVNAKRSSFIVSCLAILLSDPFTCDG